MVLVCDSHSITTNLQVIDTGHYCLPVDSDVNFLPLSKQIELEFLSLVSGRRMGDENVGTYDKSPKEAITDLGTYMF